MVYGENLGRLQTLMGMAHLQGDEALEVAMQVAGEWKDKFDLQEVNSALVLRTGAMVYAQRYEGNFAYMVSMKEQVLKDNWLSPAQCKGVLNCMRAEVHNKKKQERGGNGKSFERQPDVIGAWGIKPRPGIFTIVFDEDDPDDRITLRLKKAPEFMTVESGTLIAEYLYGPDNESSYKGFAFVKPDNKAYLWKAFRNDYEEEVTRLAKGLEIQMMMDEHHRFKAGEAYALESGNCAICGRTLTVPASISRGIGPDCWKKLTAEYSFDEELLSQEAI